MCTHIEVIVTRMANLVVNHSSCYNRGTMQIYMSTSKRQHLFTCQVCKTYENILPGWTLSGDPGWKNIVWWFFCAIITRNLGHHFSSRNLQASMIWSSSMLRTWLNCDSLTPSLQIKWNKDWITDTSEFTTVDTNIKIFTWKWLSDRAFVYLSLHRNRGVTLCQKAFKWVKYKENIKCKY